MGNIIELKTVNDPDADHCIRCKGIHTVVVGKQEITDKDGNKEKWYHTKCHDCEDHKGEALQWATPRETFYETKNGGFWAKDLSTKAPGPDLFVGEGGVLENIYGQKVDEFGRVIDLF